jgi:hypothetical protein
MNNTFFYLKEELRKAMIEEETRRIDYLAKYENALKNESTETRWNQLTAGTITKEKAIEYATARIKKDIEKQLEKKLAHLDAVAAAPDLKYITVITWFTRYGTGKAEVRTNNDYNEGTAGGWGYDKESAAVAEAFNNDLAILKALYTIKEKALAEGQTDHSETACTGRDNRNIIGYGAGYAAIPYFEGGVGVNCFWAILKKAGFETKTTWGKRENVYNITVA